MNKLHPNIVEFVVILVVSIKLLKTKNDWLLLLVDGIDGECFYYWGFCVVFVAVKIVAMDQINIISAWPVDPWLWKT